MKIILNNDDIKTISLFQQITGSSVLYCENDVDIIYFIVGNGQYGMSVGKGGEKIKKAEKKFGKKIKIIEYFENSEEFIKNMIPSYKDVQIEENKAKVIIKNGFFNKKQIDVMTKILKKIFDIESFKISKGK